jgi:hypothetical protein
VQGLDAEAVARREEQLFARIPEDEGVFAAQFAQAFDAHIFVQMQQDFAVGPRTESVAARFETGTNPFEVVELAVYDDMNRAVFVAQGLVTSGEVDDAEPGLYVWLREGSQPTGKLTEFAIKQSSCA